MGGMFLKTSSQQNFRAKQNAAFTWLEALVAIAVISVLILLILPFNGGGLEKGEKTQTLSHMKQLHLATQSMALDGLAARNTNLAWPGDTGGTFTNWMRHLVPEYVGTNDFCKLLSAPGVKVPEGALPAKMSEGALCIYAVRDDSPGTAVFLTTANFTNASQGGQPLQRSAKPYGNTGFVVFRKGGDGAILLKNQATSTNLVGTYAPLLN